MARLIRVCYSYKYLLVSNVMTALHFFILQYLLWFQRGVLRACSKISCNPLRGCFEQDRFTWKVLSQVFPGFERGFAGNTVTPQQTTKNLQNTSHSLATHFHKCCLRACVYDQEFRPAPVLQSHLERICYILLDVSFSKTWLHPCFPIFPNTFPTKFHTIHQTSPQKLHKAAKGCKSGHLKKIGKACSFCKSPPRKVAVSTRVLLTLRAV